MSLDRLEEILESFNSRTHAGCDLRRSHRSFVMVFQFTHPRGVRYEGVAPSTYNSRFNSRTHAGCDVEAKNRLLGILVSIHAPTRGAIGEVLVHSPHGQFQFTHPRGVRSISQLDSLPETVSIHAPTRGAMFEQINLSKSIGFNSRTHAGCDFGVDGGFVNYTFQFTHPRGVRCLEDGTYDLDFVSIHAPTRGAIGNPGNQDAVGCFNSRTHAGCDRDRQNPCIYKASKGLFANHPK
ncbi:hypothetical protein SAMN05720468_10412 [Fibrobacter sp. UWEL]|nr:hypothetical protein SAMN05720468_10412 [Fibrobacter sp. UWEL]